MMLSTYQDNLIQLAETIILKRKALLETYFFVRFIRIP